MRKYLHEWQKPFDIGGFHFSSILQAEAILMFLNYRGNVKLIADKMGNTNRIPIDAKLRRFRKDNDQHRYRMPCVAMPCKTGNGR